MGSIGYIYAKVFWGGAAINRIPRILIYFKHLSYASTSFQFLLWHKYLKLLTPREKN